MIDKTRQIGFFHYYPLPYSLPSPSYPHSFPRLLYRPVYEFFMKGYLFKKGPMKILVFQLLQVKPNNNNNNNNNTVALQRPDVAGSFPNPSIPGGWLGVSDFFLFPSACSLSLLLSLLLVIVYPLFSLPPSAHNNNNNNNNNNNYTLTFKFIF